MDSLNNPLNFSILKQSDSYNNRNCSQRAMTGSKKAPLPIGKQRFLIWTLTTVEIKQIFIYLNTNVPSVNNSLKNL